MNDILSIIQENTAYITMGLAAISIILLIIVLVLLKSVSRLEKRYKKLMRGTEAKSLEENIEQYLNKVDETIDKIGAIEVKNQELENRINNCIQKVAITRYKAFDDVGSDLSFSIALLDENNDGVVITGLYSRNDSTTYAKPIDKGISRYDLSDEELQVLNESMKK